MFVLLHNLHIKIIYTNNQENKEEDEKRTEGEVQKNIKEKKAKWKYVQRMTSELCFQGYKELLHSILSLTL